MSSINALASFEDNVKAKLKNMVAELIPDERFNLLVHESIRDFEENHIRDLVKKELTKHFEAMVREEMGRPEWQAQWGNSGQVLASDVIRKLITENSGTILANMMSRVVEDMVFQLNNHVSRTY